MPSTVIIKMKGVVVVGARYLKELYVELSNNCLLECLHCSSLASPQGNTFIDLKLIPDIREKMLSGELY